MTDGYTPSTRLELFFKVDDLREILDSKPTPDTIRVSLTFMANTTSDATPSIAVALEGINANGVVIGTTKGPCPWPCK